MADEDYRQLTPGGANLSDLTKRRETAADRCNHEKPVFLSGNSRKACFHCSPKNGEKRVNSEKINCTQCGIPFVCTTFHKKIYCSESCKNKSKYDIKTAGDLTCKCCGVIFRNKDGEQRTKYCSKECSYKFLRTNQPIKCGRHARPCKVCGVVFVYVLGNRKKLTCSDACQKTYRANIKQGCINRKMDSDPVYKLTRKLRTLIGQSIKRVGHVKSMHAEDIIGCSFEFFKSHIERQFLKGMTWENRDAFHIDHITPIATAKTEAEVIALNHFTNLRPMWAKDNMAKSDKITHLI